MTAALRLSAALRALADAIEELPQAGGPDRVLRYEEVGERLGLGISAVRKRAQAGAFPVVEEDGSAPGVRSSDLDAYIRNLPVRGRRRPRGPHEVKKSARPLRALMSGR